MKKLYLMRHAKSSWDNLDLSDFDRPLNERGRRAAPAIGNVLKEKAIKPHLVLCSPAVRTRETLELLKETAELESVVNYCDTIYEASIRELRALMHEQSDDIESLMLIGHNPAIESLQYDITGEHEPFPTAALAAITLKVESWSELSGNTGSLDWFIRPRDLESL